MNLLFGSQIIFCIVIVLAYSISFFAIPVITKAAKRRHLFDHPDYKRKVHSKAVPTLGGIAIFLAFLLSYSISPWSDQLDGFSYLVASLLILFFVGLKDDLVTLSAWKKLLAQIIAGVLITYGSGIYIDNFYGVLGFSAIPYWAALPVTVFTIIVVINAVNLIDGIDGLAGGIGTLASVLFGSAFLFVGEWSMAMFSFCIAGALLGFLKYNFSPASIFMGDTGSMLLGFLLSVEAIKFIQLGDSPALQQVFGDAVPVLAILILAFPLFDTLRVVLKRYLRGKSIFSPGQDHIHHELLRMGFTHKSASILLYAETIILIALIGTLSLGAVDVNILLGMLIVSCMLIYPTNGLKRRIFSKLFGYKWQRLFSRKWGIQLDRRNIHPLDIVSQVPDYKIFDLPVKKTEEKEVNKVSA